MFKPGQSILQRYLIQDRLAEGGQAIIYTARDITFDRKVVLKVLKMQEVDLADSLDIQREFNKTTKLFAALDHPNIPKLFDFFWEQKTPCFVMEFVEGQTLQELQKKQPDSCFSENDVKNWGIQLCDLLTYLHTLPKPIIIRDIKPDNLVLTPYGQVKLIDFGTARTFKEYQPNDTQPLGTLGYAPPEQYGQGQTGPYSDVYALAVTLLQLVTGYNPALTQGFLLPRADFVRQGISKRFSDAIEKATLADPIKRTQTGSALKRDLLPVSPTPTLYQKKGCLFLNLIVLVVFCVLTFAGILTFSLPEIIVSTPQISVTTTRIFPNSTFTITPLPTPTQTRLPTSTSIFTSTSSFGTPNFSTPLPVILSPEVKATSFQEATQQAINSTVVALVATTNAQGFTPTPIPVTKPIPSFPNASSIYEQYVKYFFVITFCISIAGIAVIIVIIKNLVANNSNKRTTISKFIQKKLLYHQTKLLTGVNQAETLVLPTLRFKLNMEIDDAIKLIWDQYQIREVNRVKQKIKAIEGKGERIIVVSAEDGTGLTTTILTAISQMQRLLVFYTKTSSLKNDSLLCLSHFSFLENKEIHSDISENTAVLRSGNFDIILPLVQAKELKSSDFWQKNIKPSEFIEEMTAEIRTRYPQTIPLLFIDDVSEPLLISKYLKHYSRNRPILIILGWKSSNFRKWKRNVDQHIASNDLLVQEVVRITKHTRNIELSYHPEITDEVMNKLIHLLRRLRHKKEIKMLKDWLRHYCLAQPDLLKDFLHKQLNFSGELEVKNEDWLRIITEIKFFDEIAFLLNGFPMFAHDKRVVTRAVLITCKHIHQAKTQSFNAQCPSKDFIKNELVQNLGFDGSVEMIQMLTSEIDNLCRTSDNFWKPAVVKMLYAFKSVQVK